ncbi:photosynthetic NDH subunit of subcomplex B 4, chloroplastic [Canna indica]|uniref:Photosynthetic NDH subunit of subcomplex B 4, chloroplastic n=1 Tax=Canna indica TaxID=4628 RepID=A0AAQ3QA40_9LILI|nr:photosynthetic NDH subunit of subcomplex B 4, chloroplastic [Canna indica]
MQSTEGKSGGRSSSWKLNAFPDVPLMAVMVEHVANQRDYVVHKSIWHLSDETMKNIYTMYIMFTCWGCCFFGSTKDPFYDGEEYRKDEEMEQCTGYMKSKKILKKLQQQSCGDKSCLKKLSKKLVG